MSKDQVTHKGRVYRKKPDGGWRNDDGELLSTVVLTQLLLADNISNIPDYGISHSHSTPVDHGGGGYDSGHHDSSSGGSFDSGGGGFDGGGGGGGDGGGSW